MNMKDTNNWQIVSASEVEEFFYQDTDEVVSEGDAVGIEIDNEDSVDLVLFGNLYWSDQNLD